MLPLGKRFCTRYSVSPNLTSRNDVTLGCPRKPCTFFCTDTTAGELAEQAAHAIAPARLISDARTTGSGRRDRIRQESLTTAEADSTTRRPPDSTALSRIATRSAPAR